MPTASRDLGRLHAIRPQALWQIRPISPARTYQKPLGTTEHHPQLYVHSLPHSTCSPSCRLADH